MSCFGVVRCVLFVVVCCPLCVVVGVRCVFVVRLLLFVVYCVLVVV